MGPHFPNHPNKTAPRFTNHLSQSDTVSRIRGPHFPNWGTSFHESPRCPVFLWSAAKVPPFPESGDLISRIVQVLGFPVVSGQGAAVSRIGTVFGQEKMAPHFTNRPRRSSRWVMTEVQPEEKMTDTPEDIENGTPFHESLRHLGWLVSERPSVLKPARIYLRQLVILLLRLP
jgi:hypothetical protein